jgi:hypothetical protein
VHIYKETELAHIVISDTKSPSFTFLAFSDFTVMLPVPGPTSSTTSVGLKAAQKQAQL